jgi:hypothetical protein
VRQIDHGVPMTAGDFKGAVEVEPVARGNRASRRRLLAIRLRDQVQIEGIRVDATRTLLVVDSLPEGENRPEREVLTEAEAHRLIARGLADPIPGGSHG